jgi:hypothetical protein
MKLHPSSSQRPGTPGSIDTEAHFYRQAAKRLVQAGFDAFRVNCN